MIENLKRYAPHDLIWLSTTSNLKKLPPWFSGQQLATNPVVVRRAPMAGSMLPIGIRGNSRSERFATYIDLSLIVNKSTPQSLVNPSFWQERAAVHPLKHWDYLHLIDKYCKQSMLSWGIIGSLGFELASKIATAGCNSDIDITIKLPKRPSRMKLALLFSQLKSIPIRVDVQLETLIGGIALDELVHSKQKVMVKTDYGPILVKSPWLQFSK